MSNGTYHGAIGNGLTAALVGSDLAVDWLCIPRFDGVPILAGALDPRRGGRWSLGIRVDGRPLLLGQKAELAYLGRTNLLQARVARNGVEVRITDFMPWNRNVLVRQVEVKNTGTPPRRVEFSASFQPVESVLFLTQGGSPLPGQSWRAGPAAWLEWGPSDRIEWELKPGEEARWRLVLGFGATPEEARENLQFGLDASVEETRRFWEEWIAGARRLELGDLDRARPTGLQEAYLRSLLALKLLIHAPTGAILAAPTASFPAVPGGGDNWDYRFAWVRDGCYVAEALDRSGFHDEARGFYEFLRGLQENDGSWSLPLYTIDGTGTREFEAPDLAGGRGERPIRFGNAAAGQLQLDTVGTILHGLWVHYRETGDREYLARWWPAVKRALTWLEQHWQEPESGIWEFRDRPERWVHGQALCAVAFDLGARIAEELGQAEETGQAETPGQVAATQAWCRLSSRILAETIQQGWNAKRGAFVRHFGEDAPLDASVLALALYGLLPPEDSRIRATVSAMEQAGAPHGGRGLLFWGALARYDHAVLPFYMPTLWLARYHLAAGDRERAMELVETCIRGANPLGLMAEHFDPRTGEQWGNFPQAFSHEELIQTLWDWAAAADHDRAAGIRSKEGRV